MDGEADQKRVYWKSNDGDTIIYKMRGEICGRSLYTIEHLGVRVMDPAVFEVVQRYWSLEFDTKTS